MERVCCVCLNKFSENPLSAEEPLLLNMINECFHLKVEEFEIQANNICEHCISDVRAAIRFKRNYEQNIKLKESREDDFIDSLEAENWELVSGIVKEEPEVYSDVDCTTDFEPVDEAPISTNQKTDDTNFKTGNKHVCNFCDKVFTKKFCYTTHLRVHTGERPYSCPHCTKTFTQASSRNTHLLVHTGERNFKCPYCTKYFTRKHNLQKHLGICWACPKKTKKKN